MRSTGILRVMSQKSADIFAAEAWNQFSTVFVGYNNSKTVLDVNV
jgi:hypothetical protein